MSEHHNDNFTLKKIQQDATAYQNFLFHIYMKLSVLQ